MSTRNPDKLLESLLALGRECEWVEYKCNVQNPDDIGEYVSALSNSAALHGKKKGYVVWGIEDQTLAVRGTTFEPYKKKAKGNEPLINWLTRWTAPHTDFRIHEFSHKDKRIVIFEIDRARSRPVKFRSRAYVRIGECKQPLETCPELERKLWMCDPNEDFSAQICEGATVSDLLPASIEKARQEYKIKNPRLAEMVDGWDDITFLNKAKFCVRGKITKTAIILLGRPESEHYLSPSIAKISWILKDKDGIELDYEHFGPPCILNVEKVFAKIRNLKYRYLQDETLFPTEIDQYEPWVIREALHNCIAHQDYNLAGRINVVEMPDSLLFTNLGQFIPDSVEEVIRRDAPEEIYRNRFLADAMVNCGMIDTIGSGIKKMFRLQKERYFPLPEYRITKGKNPRVELRIEGKILNPLYTKILISNPETDIETTILLDTVQRKGKLSKQQVRVLRGRGFIEGRYPNVYLSASVASETDAKAAYIKNRGLDNEFYKQQIIEHIRKFGGSTRREIDDLIIKQLPGVLDLKQRKRKVNNLLSELRSEGKIVNNGRSRRCSRWEIKQQ